VSIFPSPTIACVGVNEKAENVLKSYFSKDTSAIYLLGESRGNFGGSLIAKVLDKKVAGELEDIDFNAELKLWDFLLKANEVKLLDCANSIGIGGIAITLAKMCAMANLGINAKTNFIDKSFIFEESPTRVIIGVKDEEEFIKFANEMGIKFTKLGNLNEEDFILDDVKISLDDLKNTYFNNFKNYLG
ncbi:AIR synthase-related protein, partial [Campylobacter lari]